MQKKKGPRRGIFLQMLSVILVPLLAFVIMVMVFETRQITQSLQNEIKEKLKDDAEMALYLYEQQFPGDYSMDSSTKVIYKGGVSLEEGRAFVDKIKEITDADITFYYKDVRVLTTLKDKEGNFITQTKANSVVKNTVLDGKQETFYPNSTVEDEEYFAYYAPICDASGNATGMIFAGKPSKYVDGIIKKALLPVGVILVIYIIILIGIITVYSRYLASVIVELKAFLLGVSGGNLDTPIKKKIYERNDELGDIAKSADVMRGSLKDLIEKDPLTGLYNRRYGLINMNKLIENSKKYANSFFVCLADIDFFKKFNDAYGHDCGDEVLRTVSDILKDSVGRNGVACRWGGEEFLLVFEADNMDAAFADMNKLITQVRKTVINYRGIEVKVTISVGLTEGDFEEDNDTIIKRADDGLYMGKESGRDRVVIMDKFKED